LWEPPASRISIGYDQIVGCHGRGLDPALISDAPHYGLRYGCAPATGNVQRLRGRPPLVSPLKSCMGRSFTAVTRVKITEEANVANENEHALHVRACRGFARPAADDANSDGHSGTE